MSSPRVLILTLLVCSATLLAQPQSTPLGLSEYIARLDEVSEALKGSPDSSVITNLVRKIPPEWSVEAQGKTFKVDNSWMVETLRRLSRTSDTDLLFQLQSFVSARRDNALALQEPPRDLLESRAVLQSILSSSEFRAVSGPDWYDRLKQKIWQIVFSALQKALGSSVAPLAGKALAWAIAVIVLLMVGLWVYRTLKRGIQIESISPDPVPVSARGWAAWLADARANANQGRWREAIHFAYWAGVSRLEEEGLWRPDRARTPREYLKLLPASSPRRPMLTQLTSQFELVWYAGRPAGAAEFSGVITLLEQLGCR